MKKRTRSTKAAPAAAKKKGAVDAGAGNMRGLGRSSGRSGLVRFGGMVQDEWLRELQGERGRNAFREMWDNDAVVGSVRYAVELFAQAVTWDVETTGPTPDDEAAVAFVKGALNDMERTLEECVVDSISMMPYGWAWQEMLFKVRGGPDATDAAAVSDYDDGLVGLRDLATRAQTSHLRWVFAGEDADAADLAKLGAAPLLPAGLTRGSVLGWIQSAAPDFKEYGIPRWKSLHFRLRAPRDNPEGYSCLRNAYRSWFFKKRFEELEGVGIERDLAGLPVMEAPESVFDEDDGDSVALLARLEEMVASVRNDSRAGLVIPNKDAGFDFRLESSGGSRAIDVGKVIERYDARVAMTMLADFVLLGHEEVGSFALASSKTRLFSVACGALFKAFAREVNARAIPLLFWLNRNRPGCPKPTVWPRLVPGDVETPELEALGAYLSQLAAAGFSLAGDRNVENAARRAAKLPPLPEGKEGEEMLAGAAAGAAAAEPAAPGQEEPDEEPEDPPTTEVEKAAVWKAADGRREKVIAQLRGPIAAELRRQYKAVERAVRQSPPKTRAGAKALVERALKRAAAEETLGNVLAVKLTPAMQREALRGAKQAAKLVARHADGEEQDGWDFSADTRRYLRSKPFKGRLAKTARRTLVRLADALGEGAEAGETMNQLTDRVAAALRIDELARAGAIARTETLGAMNAAAVSGYKQAGASGKEWLATKDSRTRDDHADADGQVVGLEEKFDVGGEALEHPGDPSGSAENVINCRCSTAPAVAPR